MLFRLILALAFAGFLGAVTLPGDTIAQTTQTEEKKETKKKTTKTKEEKDETKKKSAKSKEEKDETKKKSEKEKKEKKLTPAQQRMKDCGAKWQEHKKETGEKTKDQYNSFLKKCMKKDA
ncbi:MAG: hypothetical protein KGZ73_10380 [Rhizobiales bacterium]|nr:hypothetical protein [Hyphomicrobiales bacterium]